MEKILTKDFITDDKTNKVFISSLIDTETGDLDKEARDRVKSCIMQFEKDCELLYNTKDVWARDYMPIQLTKNTYLGYTYKPDYLTKSPEYAKCVTNWKLHNVHAEKYDFNGFKVVQIPLILDGGNVVKAILDDKPCMIMCDKVLLENNIDKNNKTELENFHKWWKEWWEENFDGTEMKLVLLPWEGSKVDPIGHADGMIRYIDKNKVLITNYKDFNEEHYNEMMKVLGPKPKGFGFNVISLHFSDLEQFKNNKLFSVLLDSSWCYINYLQVGTRILVPRLGYDLLDNEALKQIREAFSANELSYEIELISQDMTSIVEDMNDKRNSGGALNCLTWTIQS